MKAESNYRFAYLDFSRGLAILGVILIHSFNEVLSSLSQPLYFFASNGSRGVQLFYAISGLTIAYSLQRNQNKLFFYLNRFFRIAPLFYFMLIVYSLRYGFNLLSFSALTHFTFTHMFFPTHINSVITGEWSIAVEMIFYALAPLLISKIDGQKKAMIATGVSIFAGVVLKRIILSIFTKHGLTSDDYINYAYFWLPTQLPFFLLGFTLFYSFNEKSPSLKVTKKLALVLMVASCVLFYFTVTLYLWGLFFAGLLIFLKESESLLMGYISKQIVRIGQLSFSIYLIHTSILGESYPLFERLKFNSALYGSARFLFCLSVSWMVASLTYKWIEKPFIDFGKKLGANLISRRQENV